MHFLIAHVLLKQHVRVGMLSVLYIMINCHYRPNRCPCHCSTRISNFALRVWTRF